MMSVKATRVVLKKMRKKEKCRDSLLGSKTRLDEGLEMEVTMTEEDVVDDDDETVIDNEQGTCRTMECGNSNVVGVDKRTV
jgi:hypothetical protein